MTFDGIISLGIACIEFIYLFNALLFAKKNLLNKILMLQLLLLLVYQTIEFFICFVGLRQQLIVYFAFFDITFLPPIALYSVLLFSEKLKPYHKFIFIPAIFFIVYYPFVLDQFAVTKCTVLYASYHYPLGDIYAIFYYLPIIGSMIILNKKWGRDANPKQKAQTRLLFFGYLFTFIPAMIFAILIPSFISAVESLLCKMAFVLATFVTIFLLNDRNRNILSLIGFLSNGNNSKHISNN